MPLQLLISATLGAPAVQLQGQGVAVQPRSSPLPLDIPADVITTLRVALNKYTVTRTAISLIPRWCLYLVLSSLEENIPALYFLILSLSLYKTAPSSDPHFPSSISLLTALLTATACKAQKGGTKFGPGKMKS